MTDKELSMDIYNNEKEHGFWVVDEIVMHMEKSDFSETEIKAVKSAFRSQKLMLIVSELSEAMEADRHNKRFTGSINSIKGWSNTSDFNRSFQQTVKDTFEDELADASIRITGLAVHENCDLQTHIEIKHRFNKTRPFMHNKEF